MKVDVSADTGMNVDVTQDAYYNPTVASGDVVELDDETADGGTATLATDGDLVCVGCDGTYDTLDYCISDVTNATDATFTTPSCWTNDDVIHIASTRPIFDQDLGETPFLFYVGVDIGTVSLTCLDDDGQAVTISSRDAAPSNITLSSNALTGTPDTEDENGWTMRLDCPDTGLLYATMREITGYTTDDAITAPQCVGDSVATCISDLAAVRPWLAEGNQLSATFQCSTQENEDKIITQDPAAMDTLEAEDDPLVVTVGLGICSSGSGLGKKVNSLGVGL
jgi:hypothetical protein